MPILPLPDDFKRLSRQAQNDRCIGRLFLIALRFEDLDGNLIGEVRTEGRLESLDRPGTDYCVGKFRREDGRLVEAGFDIVDGMWLAEGKFTNPETGRTVEPDFAIASTISGGDAAEHLKQFE